MCNARLSIALWLLSVLFAPVAQADGPASAREHYNRGTALFDLGRYREAAGEYEAAYELKNDPALLFNIGQAYRLAGESANALRAYRAFLRRMPGSGNRAEVQSRIDELQAAVDAAHAKSAHDPPAPAPAPEIAPAPVVAPAEPAPTTVAPAPVVKIDGRVARTEKVAGIGLLAGGGALLVTGAVLVGLAAKANNDVIDASSTFVPAAETRRNALQVADAVCFAIGGAAAITGVVLYVVGHRGARRSQLAAAFSPAGIRF